MYKKLHFIFHLRPLNTLSRPWLLVTLSLNEEAWRQLDIYDANNAKVQVETVFVQKVFGIWPGAVNSFHVKCLFQPRGPAMCIKYSQTTALHHNFVMFLTFAKCYYSLLYISISIFYICISGMGLYSSGSLFSYIYSAYSG